MMVILSCAQNLTLDRCVAPPIEAKNTNALQNDIGLHIIYLYTVLGLIL